VWRDEVTRERIEELYQSAQAPALVSFDLDAVTEAEAPGVSAPSAGGLSSELWLAAAYAAGRSPAVASADVVELNPAVDRDGQTARLAALTVWWILRGYTERR
jgi:formiminoglutamase